ncbi:Fc.00g077990.m01.CDS01 [Cosmosporella sp. VM-42]
MTSPTCPLCYNLDKRKLRRLTEATCSMGQTSRHWMQADALRASAKGVGSTSHTGVERLFIRSCERCALVRDAVETFLRESGLAGSGARILDYMVAVQDTDEEAEGEDDDDGSGSDTVTESSWQDVDDETDDGILSDEENRGSAHLQNKTTEKKDLKKLQIVLRCSFTPPKAIAQDACDEEFELEIFSPSGDVSPSLGMVGKAGDVVTTLSPIGYATTIKKWLQECLDNHSTCQQFATVTKPKPLPKRVLDLSNDKVVLIETGLREDLYVALSHCWGKEQILITTKETMADRMRDIPFETLPSTFQDAVLITRALGLRYLWIDSLCIIQGDVRDWEDQSAKMADIYTGCYLNIATTRSSSGKEGFLGPRWTSRNTWDWVRHFNAAASSSAGEPESRYRKCAVESYAVSNHDDVDRYASSDLKVRLTVNASHDSMQTFRWIYMYKVEAPLIQRGWVYQERNLSPRTVHFHSNEMMWDCPDMQRCECSTLNSLEIGGDGWSASKSRISTMSSLGQSQVHGLWRTVVEDYCLLDLTYESDRLPALGGLATKFFEHMPKDEYLAGLWKSSLGRDLLWKVDSESAAKVSRRWQLGDKTPPSWSWASLVYGQGRHGISWEFETKPKLAKFAETFTYKQDPRFSLTKASCSFTSPSQFGNVSGGSITVTGAMCAIAVINETAPIPRGWADQIPIKSQELFNSLHLNYDDPKDQEHVTSQENPVRGLIFFLFVGTFFSHFELDKKNTHPHHQGLMLKPSTRIPGAAERIGSWGQFIESWTEGKAVFLKEAAVVTVTIV